MKFTKLEMIVLVKKTALKSMTVALWRLMKSVFTVWLISLGMTLVQNCTLLKLERILNFGS